MNHFAQRLSVRGPLILMFYLVVFAQNVNGVQSSLSRLDEDYAKAKMLNSNKNYEEALKLFEKVYKIRLDSFGPKSARVADVLAYIGGININLALYDKALNYYFKAEDIYTRMGNNGLLSLTYLYVNLASCYLKNGDVEKARSYYENADRLFQELNMVKTPQYESLLINLTTFYIDNKDYNKALNYNDKAFKISTEALQDYIKWTSRGFIYYEMRDNEKSLECYHKALKVMERDYGVNYSGKKEIYNNLGSVYLNLNEYDKALDCFEQSKAIVMKNSGIKNASYSECLNMIGKTYLSKTENTSDLSKFLENKKKNINSALEYYQQALCAISQDFTGKDYSKNPDIRNTIDNNQLLVSLKNKAEGLSELSELYEKEKNNELCIKNLESALKAFHLSTKVVSLIRTGFVNQESRLFLAANEHAVYTGAVNAAVHLFELTKEKKYFEQAFEFSERSRSTDFLTMVRNSRAKQFGGMPDSLIQKETELKSQIDAYKSFVFNESTKPEKDVQKIGLWNDKIFELGQSYSKLILLFEKEYPKYYDFKYADQVVKVDDVQSRLKPREALIEYMVNEPVNGKDGKLITFLLTKNKYEIFTQTIDSSFENSVNLFLQFLRKGSAFNTRKKDYVQYSLNAHKLHNWLISSFSREIQDCRLVVIPDGKLSYLPFDAFITAPPDTSKMDFRSLKYLVYDHAVSYTYSATLSYYYLNNNKPAKKELLAFVPQYNGLMPSNNQTNDQHHEQFFPLPGANIEVKGITKMIDGQVLKDDAATKEKFKTNAGNFDILHLAMHTLINDSLPMFSKLLFSRGINNDGSLDIYEVYNMNLKSRLAVLSACNTGSGRLQKGEGVMSLARAFLYAGCPAIVMTLWSVEDVASADLMIDFYKNLLSGYSKDEALRKAKIKHIKTADPLKAHPYFWLGYVSIGDQQALYHTKTIYFLGMVLAIILAIVIEKFYFHQKR